MTMPDAEKGGLISKVIGDKRRWRQYKARVRQLPPNYRMAAEAIERYLLDQSVIDAAARRAHTEEGRTDHHTLRGLLTGTPDGGTAIAAAAWCAGLTLAGYLWARSCSGRTSTTDLGSRTPLQPPDPNNHIPHRGKTHRGRDTVSSKHAYATDPAVRRALAAGAGRSPRARGHSAGSGKRWCATPGA
jgi:hypothetical protein